MTKPTKQQKDFVLGKAKEALESKAKEIREEHTVPATIFTVQDMHDLVVSGKVKVRPNVRQKGAAWEHMDRIYNFDRFIKKVEKDAYLPKKQEREIKVLRDKYDAFELEVMLADTEDLAESLKKLLNSI